MNDQEMLIEQFYRSFQQKDYKGMQALYSDSARFSDPVFRNLNAEQVKAMWEMLISSSRDMRIEFSNIRMEGERVWAHWDAYYTFSGTGRAVVNRVDSVFFIRDGKIEEQQDHFSFHRWARQAFGFGGFLLGWTQALQHKVSERAMSRLQHFMQKG